MLENENIYILVAIVVEKKNMSIEEVTKSMTLEIIEWRKRIHVANPKQKKNLYIHTHARFNHCCYTCFNHSDCKKEPRFCRTPNAEIHKSILCCTTSDNLLTKN